MALTRTEIEARLDEFFNVIKTNIASSISDKAIPLLDKLSSLPGGSTLDPFQALKNQILSAVDSAGDVDVARSVATAINGLNVPGLVATATASGGIDLSIANTVTVDTGAIALSTNGALGDLLSLSAQGSASFQAGINARVSFDSTGAFSLVDTGAPEVNVGIDANFSLQNLQANLGLATIQVRDASTTTPEFSADFGLDLSLAGGAFTVTPSVTGSAALDLNFETTFIGGLLPKIKGELVVDFSNNGIEFGAPTISLRNLTLSLKDYLGIVGDTLGDVAKIFNHGALGTIVDIATEPVPALDGLAQAFPYLYGIFDKVGSISGGGDNVITIGDLAAYTNPSLTEPLANFYRAIAIISELRKFGATNNAGEISFGGGSLFGSTTTPNIDVDSVIAQLSAQVDGFSELSDIAKTFLKTIDSALPAEATSTGFTFSLLENPETILDIFFQKNTPVDIVRYDVPALSFDVAAGGFFPVLGPLGFVLKGALRAGIDVDIGYDTQGLATGNFFDGFFFTTAADNPDINGPSRLNKNTGVVFPYEPVGWLDTTLTGGAGINFVAGEAGVAADFGFNVDAYFKQEKFRPTSADFGCAFDISGRAYVDVHLYIEVGFGPFSIEKNISLASATLADFNSFKCPPPSVVATPLEPGLATFDGTDVLLNVGDRAQFRIIKDDDGGRVLVGNPDDPATKTIDERQVEGYVISLARNQNGDDVNPLANPAPTLVPGQLDITAFGFTQRIGASGIIRADFKGGNDLLVIQSDVLTDSDISGGDGNDSLTGGGGRDTLRGDAGADFLTGGDGNDILRGGADNDTLDGGRGGDVLDGGDGFDTVDYSRSNRDVGVGIYVTLADTGYYGSGGDAEGDTFISVENVIGTDFDDYIRATGASFRTFLEGGRGNDVLIGGNNGDLLLGGEGGDTLSGQGGEDGTSYVTSWGRVDVDLQRAVQIGGDAQGDRLYSVEDVQGSIFSDVLRGDAGKNLLDGSNGNDVLEGRGGQDTVLGGFGDDLIYGGGDGDTLDGGPGFDTLSYEKLAGPVTVDLGRSQETSSGGTTTFVGSAPDKIVMEIPGPTGGRGVSSFNNLIGTNNATGDTLTGDIRANRIEGLAGNDFLSGDGGNDVLIGGAGADVIIGGAGSDWTYYNDSASGVTVDLLGVGSGGTAQGDTYDILNLFGATVENILGSRFGDTLLGNGLDNIIDPNISGAQVTETVDGRTNPVGGAGDILRLDYSSWQADRGQGVVGGFASGSPSQGGLNRLTTTGGATLDQVNFTNIERLFITGTTKADTIYGGQLADRIYTGSGNDIVVAGRGADDVHTEGGDDTVAWGTNLARTLDFFGGKATTPASFHLDGGRGLDTLSIDLSFSDQDLTLTGRADATEFTGVNLRLSNAATAENFEYLGDVRTAGGNDRITQAGVHDNRFDTGSGEDIIAPGLGFDRVDGGLDLVGTESGYGLSSPFADAKGDRLVLDYSSLGPDQAVRGSSNLAQVGIFVGGNPLYTNNGFYSAADPTLPNTLTTSVSFSGMEGLTVTGSRGNDSLVGTNTVYQDLYGRQGISDNRGGDDVLSGGDGNDSLFGLTGDDILMGGAGNDILQGAASPSNLGNGGPVNGGSNFSDLFEVDVLTGGAGADKFVLGDTTGSFYNDGGNSSRSVDNRAIIKDFNAAEGDTIVLHAGSGYAVRIVGTTARLFIDDGAEVGYGQDSDQYNELIAEIENAPDFDISAAYVTYASNSAGARSAAVSTAAVAPAAVATPAASSLARTASVSATLAPAAPWVTSTTDLAALKTAFEGAAAPAGSTLTLDGSAEAFGSFSGDPFGLGSGLILSTGRVEDLPGANTVVGPSSYAGSIPLNFVRIGQTDGTTVYRADLSHLGVDVRSLLLQDGGSALGGSGGKFSGFDFDAIALSRTLIDTVPSADQLNSASFLPKLDVFDFSNSGVVLTPGSQRGTPDPDLDGSVNGLLAGVTLGLFDSTGSVSEPTGRTLSLGDGGSVGFNLTSAVSTTQPLYLYIAEAGISTQETISGTISASTNTITPAGDLSTDLGTSGPDGDTTKLTYTFTPRAGDTAFSFDAVLFSEELPEFDGTDLTDTFTIKLNGIDIGALSNGAALTIKNLVYAGSGDLVANTPGKGPLAGVIKADAYTHTLTISGAIDPGVANTLTIEVADGRDAFLDSGLLIQQGSFKTYVAPPSAANTPPQVTPPTGQILVPENTTAVTKVAATDPDPGQALTYSIYGGPDSGLFSIDSKTGALVFKAAPDFETPRDKGGDNVYDVIVKVQDNGAPPLFALQDYHVKVTDIVNEAPNRKPVITLPAGEIRVVENTTTVSKVTAIDPDAGQTLRFSITGGADKSLFTIDATTGQLAFKAAPDFETPIDAGRDNVYDVVVGVSDNGVPSLSDSRALSVRVTDAPPQITPPTGQILVPENSTTVTKVVASDPDSNEMLTYSISGGPDAGLFTIDSKTGALVFTAAPDFETPRDKGGDNVYDVTVKVQGTGTSPAFAVQDYHIKVTDIVNENRKPVITLPTGEIRVAENTTTVTKVTATDPDANQKLTFSITGGADKSLFTIDATTGQLAFKAAPDFETPIDAGHDNVYDVVVGVRDNGVPSLSDSRAVAVRVTDAAETTTLAVRFVSETAGYRNTLGWYDTKTLAGGILFGSIEADGRYPTVQPGISTARFVVETSEVAQIGYFLIPNGGNVCGPSNVGPSGPVQVVQLSNGHWAVAAVDDDGHVRMDRYGRPITLQGAGTDALFTETSKNAGGVDYASSKVGTAQTPTSLAGDTADGPTGPLAWEDLVATRRSNGSYTSPGDADYNDAVFNVVAVAGRTITGDDNANTLTGGDANDVIYGLGGPDTIDGALGADLMIGGAGDDTYVVDDFGDVADEAPAGSGGVDTVRSSISFSLSDTAHAKGAIENLTLTGTACIDATGNGLANVLIGNGAANTLDGKGGADRMEGGGGNDIYIVDDVGDRVIEGVNGGIDLVRSAVSFTLSANVENLTLTGTAAINATGNALANVLLGNAAANILDGKEGADRMEGGLGDDIYVVDNAGDRVIEGANGGTDLVISAISLTLGSNVENLTLIGGSAAVDATGNGLANVLVGNAAANTLDGKGGADTLRGLAGDDIYVVDDRGDVVDEATGGSGIDTVRSSISFSLSDTAHAKGAIENLTLTGTSAVDATGNGLANVLMGNGAANTLDGKGGADRMEGGGGNDIYIVDDVGDRVIEGTHAGTDLVRSAVSFTLGANVEKLTLTGHAAVDAVGNDLANTLTGNDASNVLTGGAGADVFVFETSLNAATNLDRITDFRSEDTIVLNNDIFTALTVPGGLAHGAFYAAAGATSAHDLDDRIVYNTATGGLYYDVDGNRAGGTAAVEFAILQNKAILTAHDFIIV